MQWWIPTFYGDVKVETIDAKHCRVIVHEATPEEQRALATLEKQALKKKWIGSGETFNGTTLVNAPTEKVAALLAKELKPGKRVISAVKFNNGKIEEITEQTFKTAAPPKASEPALASKTTPASTEPTTTPAKAEAAPAAATSVVAPTRGCPPPDFSPARLRAWAHLNAFLTEEQKADVAKFDRFVTVGGTTGHRYMITSRTARDQLRTYQRSLFDLDENRAYCVHDFDIPPEEEMHTLNILVQLPGHEAWLRDLPA